MRTKLWTLQVSVIVFFVGCYGLSEMGVSGKLDRLPGIGLFSWYTTPLVKEKVFNKLRSVTTWFTDRKFKIRGAEKPKNKIVIVEIDSDALEKFGRWPWHRDTTARLIDATFKSGAKLVGLDMMFPEPDTRMPDELKELLANDLKHPELVTKYETDKVLADTIFQYADRLVLGWSTEGSCQPLLASKQDCPIDDPGVAEGWPKFHDHLSVTKTIFPSAFDPTKTPIVSMMTVLPNIPEFSNAAEHAGFFQAYPDPDGVIRRTTSFMLGNGRSFPSLPLEMARVALKDDLVVEIGPDELVKSVRFDKSGRELPVTPLGAVEYNFRGPGDPDVTFTYVSAVDVLSNQDQIQDAMNRRIAGLSKASVLKDAYVFIGLTALGANDMRSFPFEEGVAGVEGHATLLDNILAGDLLIPGTITSGRYWILLLLVAGAALFAYAMQKLEAVPAFAVFGASVLIFGYFDFHILFAKQHTNWDTSFFYLELGSLFILTIAAKYIEEQQDKKFIHGAFSKYVAPVIVDSIMKDRSKLNLGGEKKELTILFSDIRGFTTFSEAMDAKDLSQFLNDYLGIMTRLVFEHKGTLDKYIGDAVMAFWGAPLDQPDHAANACKTAVAMMNALAQNKPRWKKDFGVDVNIGIGINSGPVSVGNMGSDQNFEYTVIGDHVNLASRMEGLTKEYGIGVVTSRFTFNVIQAAGLELPPHRLLDFVKVKGKKTAVELIEVLPTTLNEQGLKHFYEGREHYKAQRWDQAIEQFTRAGELLAQQGRADGPSEVFIERCQDFKKSPPPEGWDGSWEMTSK